LDLNETDVGNKLLSFENESLYNLLDLVLEDPENNRKSKVPRIGVDPREVRNQNKISCQIIKLLRILLLECETVF
jgi:hypothetical protein